jgi:hypothetical protein
VTKWLVPAGALATALACGVGHAGYVGYDSLFGLIWGRELASGDAPSFEGTFSPAPHPLLNVVGALLSPLGADAAADTIELLALAALVLLAVAAYRLTATLFSPLAGALAAAILVTRPELLALSLAAQFDVAFLALVLWAAALAAPVPPRPTAAVSVLVVAGLLRPEAWLMAAAYVVYLRRPKLLALAAAAPVLWALHDLVLTGDPLFSLHWTSRFAERHETGVGVADAPDLILDVTGAVVALGGAAGWLLVSARDQKRVALPAALFSVAVVPFLVYAALGLELYARFLLPAAAALAVLCAAAAAGWARAASPLVALALAASLPFTVADLIDVRSDAKDRADREEKLVAAVKPRCDLIAVPTFREVPVLMHALDLPQDRFTDRDVQAQVLIVTREGEEWRVIDAC